MQLRELVRIALEEDLGPGDLTSEACVPAAARGAARVLAKEEVVVSGQAAAAEVFAQLGASYEALVPDGEVALADSFIGRAEGPARAVLSGERVALNFLMRLCGVATHTRRVVSVLDDLGEHGLRVVDTRKTTPGLRRLERTAVRHGGAHNHRFALYDGVLIKENHIMAAGGITAAVRAARASVHHLARVEVEVEGLDELDEALAAGADAVMLDDFGPEELREGVARARGRALIEVSGGLSRERLPELARLGVDLASLGGLIHQARWVDLSMRWVSEG